MNKILLCTWWHAGKYFRSLRFKSLKALRRSLIDNHEENRHIYLHLGTLPSNVTNNEIETFMKDVQHLLQDKYELKGETIELV